MSGTAASGRRVIRVSDDIAEGVRYLRGIDGRFDRLARSLPPPPLRRSAPGFATLLRSIVSQQLSVAAADSIWDRLTTQLPPTPQAYRDAEAGKLAASGLSRSKVRYAKSLSAMVLDGSLPLASLNHMDDEEAICSLVQVPGIGRWTAEIYLMFGLGRPDVIAAADLALRESARDLFALGDRPGEGELRELAMPWSPWRAVAARMLWQHYRRAKGREGVVG